MDDFLATLVVTLIVLASGRLVGWLLWDEDCRIKVLDCIDERNDS